jgi:hypothetical protein
LLSATLSPNDILYFALPYYILTPIAGSDPLEYNTEFFYQVVRFDILDPPGLPTTNAVILNCFPSIIDPIYPKAIDYSSQDNALAVAWKISSEKF